MIKPNDCRYGGFYCPKAKTTFLKAVFEFIGMLASVAILLAVAGAITS